MTFVGFLVSLIFIELGVRPNVGAVQGAIGGATIGLAQWLVLRQRIPQSRWWILASIVSWGLIGGSGIGALGWIAPRTAQISLRLVYGGMDGAMVGALSGVAQWLVLKKQIARDGLWILVSTVSWGIGLPLGWAVGGVLHQFTHLFLSELVGLAVTWFAVAVMTGVTLVWLLRAVALRKLSED